MSKLTFEYDEKGTQLISAFAYNTGHLIEELIDKETENLRDKNILLEAKILGFLQQLEEPIKTEYANYFGIQAIKEGRV